jgi:methyl-accepting chemotaxis protein
MTALATAETAPQPYPPLDGRLPGAPSPAAGQGGGTRAVRRGIRFKLLSAFSAVLLLMVLLGAIALRSLSSVNTIASTSYEGYLLPLRQLAQLRDRLGDIDSQTLRALADSSERGRSSYTATADKDAADVETLLAAYQTSVVSADEKQAYAAFLADWRQYQDAYRSVLRAANGGDTAGATRLYFDQAAPLYARTDGDLSRLIDGEATGGQRADQEIDATYERSWIAVVVIVLVAIGVSAVLGYLLSGGIARAARQVAAASMQLAQGNLNQTIDVRSQDELGQMAQAFQIMSGRFRQLLAELQGSTQELSAASTEILAATSEQSAGASEQSAAISQTTATVNEVQASAEQAVQTASAVTDTAQHASQVAAEGVQAVQHAVSGIGDIRHKVQSIADDILSLSEQSQQIGEIIATVNDLADQSNLLALNAAIEASRAGEHGKGFAVVAQEIRTLAEQSKTATAQVRTILFDIQRATNAAVLATEQGIKGVDSGAQLVEQAGQTIDDLAEVVRQAAHAAAQITASVRQHSAGMDQIAAAMANINQATSQNLAATTNTKQAAENLAQLARRLDHLVAEYQT